MRIDEFNQLKTSEQFFKLCEFVNNHKYTALTGITISWTNGVDMLIHDVGTLRNPGGGSPNDGNQKYFKFLQLILFKVVEEFEEEIPKEDRKYLMGTTYNILHILQEHGTGGVYYIDKDINNKLYKTLKRYSDWFEVEYPRGPTIITLSDSQLMPFIQYLLKERGQGVEAQPLQVPVPPPLEPVVGANIEERYHEMSPYQDIPIPAKVSKRYLTRSDRSGGKQSRSGGKKTKGKRKTKRKSKKIKSKKRKSKIKINKRRTKDLIQKDMKYF